MFKEVQKNESASEVSSLPDMVPPFLTRLKYATARTSAENSKGEWLHISLLGKLPKDHDYSCFRDANTVPDKNIVSSLLMLGTDGIDKGSFWELED